MGSTAEEPFVSHRLSAWIEHWGPVLPLLIAEGVIALGFGAILPILPLYYTAHGVDLPTLGLVVAAWPAARLIGEPLFGRLADRTSRKWLMVGALVVSAVAIVLPLFEVGPTAFVLLRALAGFAAAAYDPAARGYLVDANLPERQGETFGLYSAAQMGGFMVGPAVGGIAVAVTGEPTVVFWVCGIAFAVSSVLVAVRVADRPRARAAVVDPAAGPAAPEAAGRQPPRLLNRLLMVALILNVGSYLASGTYEVIWSVYMTSLGASIALIGVSFFTFSLPVMLLSPFTGRYVDRRGGYFALVVGTIGFAMCGVVYPLVPSVWWMVALGLVEGTAAAFSSPALYTLVARASPAGRSSTAQGMFGAAGTAGTIVASIAAGYLASIDLRLPFVASGLTTLVILFVGMAIGGRGLWAALQPSHLNAPVPAATRSAQGTS
jgi:DHA1 family multidrug resistance protein-like MFS transporter